VDALRIIAENRIETAIINCEFDNLTGNGKPIQQADADGRFLANHLPEHYKETILQLNRRISGYNLRVLVASMQLHHIPLQK
jgi:hypothetical protein